MPLASPGVQVSITDESFFIGIGFAVPIMTAMGGMGAPPY